MTTLDIAEVRMFEKGLTVKERREAAIIVIQENIKSQIRFLCWMGRSVTIKQSKSLAFYTDYKNSLSLQCEEYGMDFKELVKEYMKTPRETLEQLGF